MTFDITSIVNALIALVSAAITVFLIPWIKAKTTKEKQEELLTWVKIAVSAAEQIFQGTNRGEEKKAYVMAFLASHGMVVDEEAVNNAVEMAVLELTRGETL